MLATWFEKPSYWKRCCCWERLKAGGEVASREWDAWMASLTQWTQVWANSGSSEGQGGLVCCSPWGFKEIDMTQWLNNKQTNLKAGGWQGLRKKVRIFTGWLTCNEGDLQEMWIRSLQEMWIQSLVRKDPLGKKMATHSYILAWEILWTEEPGGLQCMKLQRVGHRWVTKPWQIKEYRQISFYCTSWVSHFFKVKVYGHPVIDRGAWRATIHGVAKESDMTERLSNNFLIKVCALFLYI